MTHDPNLLPAELTAQACDQVLDPESYPNRRQRGGMEKGQENTNTMAKEFGFGRIGRCILQPTYQPSWKALVAYSVPHVRILHI